MRQVITPLKKASEHIICQVWHTRLVLSRRAQTEGFWKVILLILAIATIIAVGVIYFYAARGSETQLHNVTRSLRGFR